MKAAARDRLAEKGRRRLEEFKKARATKNVRKREDERTEAGGTDTSAPSEHQQDRDDDERANGGEDKTYRQEIIKQRSVDRETALPATEQPNKNLNGDEEERVRSRFDDATTTRTGTGQAGATEPGNRDPILHGNEIDTNTSMLLTQPLSEEYLKQKFEVYNKIIGVAETHLKHPVVHASASNVDETFEKKEDVIAVNESRYASYGNTSLEQEEGGAEVPILRSILRVPALRESNESHNEAEHTALSRREDGEDERKSVHGRLTGDDTVQEEIPIMSTAQEVDSDYHLRGHLTSSPTSFAVPETKNASLLDPSDESVDTRESELANFRRRTSDAITDSSMVSSSPFHWKTHSNASFQEDGHHDHPTRSLFTSTGIRADSLPISGFSLQKHQKEVADLQTYIDELTVEKLKLNGALATQASKVEELSAELSTFAETYNNQTRTIEALQTQLAERQQEILKIVDTVQTAAKERDASLRREEEAVERSRTMAAEVVALEEMMSSVKNDAESKVLAAEARVVELEQRLDGRHYEGRNGKTGENTSQIQFENGGKRLVQETENRSVQELENNDESVGVDNLKLLSPPEGHFLVRRIHNLIDEILHDRQTRMEPGYRDQRSHIPSSKNNGLITSAHDYRNDRGIDEEGGGLITWLVNLIVPPPKT